MPSSLPGKNDSRQRRITAQESAVVPDCAPESDDSPTVISKNQPTIEPTSSYKQKITAMGRNVGTPEEIVAGLRGRTLAHFELIEPIGVGGMAAVIRARDTQLDRIVALKILPPEMAQEKENIDRFHQEARAAAKLDHENIARVFFCGEDQGLFFIAFEFVDGDNLRTIMERRGQLPVAESLRYVIQIAAGLEHAATRGVVHRDVKPSNIIITPTGRAKLVDMGLARNLERQGERDLTQSGVTLGTFDYISPEQALEPREVDTRSDIYSLGCTLYHMLTGNPPVPDGTPAKKLQHHQIHFPIDPRHFAPGVPPELVAILSKMMEKNPKDRYQRPIHLVQQLMQVGRQIGVADELGEGVSLADVPAVNGQPRSHPLLFVGLALAALVVITFLFSLLPGPTHPVVKGPSIPSEEKKNVVPVVRDPNTKKGTTNGIRETAPNVISSRNDLELALNEAPSLEKKTVAIQGNIDLESGVFLKAAKDQQFKFISDSALSNGTRFHYKNQKNANTSFGFLIEGGEELEFYRLRFELDADSSPAQAVAAVALRGVKKVTFKECIFVQPLMPPLVVPGDQSSVLAASLLIDTPRAADVPPPIVNLVDCCFEGNDKTGGQVAIAINGAATVNLTNCAFKPHAAFIQFREECTRDKTIVNMQHCAGYVVNGPAFRIDLYASAQIHAKNNVFSRPEGSGLPAQGPEQNLLYLTDNLSAVQYFGDENLYHNLNAYVGSRDKFISSKDEFPKLLGKKSRDLASKEITTNPWNQADSVKRSDDLAFQLRAEYQDKFGLQRGWLGEPMPRSILAKADVPARQPKIKTKVVDAEYKGEDDRSIFTKLAGAIGEAADGDVILIKHGADREVVMPHVDLRPGVSITIKPFSEDYSPILVLDKAFRDKDTTLFRIQDSRLAIEGLEIRLNPQSIDGTQSIVLLGETAHCYFKNCVLTLHSANDVKLAAVTFVDLDRMMKMETPTISSARVEFVECFVRGTGDLIRLNGCRVLSVDLKNSLVALDGSLLEVQAGAKAVPMNEGVRWKMERSSIYTTESLFALYSKSGKGMTKTQVGIDRCMLWSLAPARPIAFHEMTDRVDNQLLTYLEWRGDQNVYANFDGDKTRDWKDQFKEMRTEHSEIRFAEAKDEMIAKLWEAAPDWFRPALVDPQRLNGIGIPPEVEKQWMPTPPEDL